MNHSVSSLLSFSKMSCRWRHIHHFHPRTPKIIRPCSPFFCCVLTVSDRSGTFYILPITLILPRPAFPAPRLPL